MSDTKPNGSSGAVPKILGPEDLKHFQDLVLSEDLVELEVRDKDFCLRLSREKPAAVHAPPAATAAPLPKPSTKTKEHAASKSVEPEKNQFHSVASPLAGMFYRSPSPQSEPFVKEGDKVAYGDTLCIVEAMKVMNEIHADRPCVIRKILVENGKPVSAGQNLFSVDPIS